MLGVGWNIDTVLVVGLDISWGLVVCGPHSVVKFLFVNFRLIICC